MSGLKCKPLPLPANDPSGLVEYTGFLKTPGIGFQTFFRFEDEDPNLQTSKEAKALCKNNCEVTHAQDTALRMAICKIACNVWNEN